VREILGREEVHESGHKVREHPNLAAPRRKRSKSREQSETSRPHERRGKRNERTSLYRAESSTARESVVEPVVVAIGSIAVTKTGRFRRAARDLTTSIAVTAPSTTGREAASGTAGAAMLRPRCAVSASPRATPRPMPLTRNRPSPHESQQLGRVILGP